ncbi:hypothetical protein [Leifsonia sp. AG29]|uniref:hypothetical protein n=1 Tax=Leifsonia sp. AG29 TaxID=2598860 RepID=UPI00131B8B55|nr:hypothetical protein [Leifsonia sp. AG29]
MQKPGERSDPVGATGRLVDTLTLQAVLDEAVIAATAADRLLAECSDGERVSAAVARSGLRLRLRFAQLGRWIEDLDLAGRNEEIRDECSRLLAFYLHLLTHAMDAPFELRRRNRLTIRSDAPLTGAPAARLQVLRDRLRAAA